MPIYNIRPFFATQKSTLMVLIVLLGAVAIAWWAMNGGKETFNEEEQPATEETASPPAPAPPNDDDDDDSEIPKVVQDEEDDDDEPATPTVVAAKCPMCDSVHASPSQPITHSTNVIINPALLFPGPKHVRFAEDPVAVNYSEMQRSKQLHYTPWFINKEECFMRRPFAAKPYSESQ